MEPLPQTRQVLTALATTSGTDLERDLLAVADRIGDLVPSCVGVSLSMVGVDLTLTFVATTPPAQVVDAVQGAHGGPCVTSPVTGEEVSVPDVLDEARWREFAGTAAAEGVRSSLSMPLLEPSGGVTASVNVYAAEPHAFDAVLEDVRRAVGPLAGQVTTNADLSFASRTRAESAPDLMADRSTIATAVGCLIAEHAIEAAAAEALLAAEAAHHGVPLVVAARSVLDRVADGRRA